MDAGSGFKRNGATGRVSLSAMFHQRKRDHERTDTDMNRPEFETIILDPGPRVFCDSCGAEWTDRKESGGILFQSKAICPECAPKWVKDIDAFGEAHLVRGNCPPGKSFPDWVRQDLRSGAPHAH